MVSESVGVEGTARLILLYAFGLTAWSLAAPTFHVGGALTFLAAAALGGRLIWLATKFARRPEDERGWLSLFLFSNLYLLLLKLRGSSLEHRPIINLGIMLVVVGIQFISTGLIAELMIFLKRQDGSFSERRGD